MHQPTAPIGITLAMLAAACPAQKHPHFNDGGALQWQTTFAAAKDAAKKADRLIFVEYGRAA